MFGRKSRQAELGQRPPGFWSQISTNLSVVRSTVPSVCLQGGICKYTAGTAVCPSGVSLPASMRKHVYGEVGYKCVPSLEYTTEGLYRNPTGRIYHCSFLCCESAALWTHTHSSSQGNVSVVFSSGGKFSCTSNLRKGYLPVCVWRGGGIETLSRLPLSSQLQSSPQLFGLWVPSPIPLPTLAGV